MQTIFNIALIASSLTALAVYAESKPRKLLPPHRDSPTIVTTAYSKSMQQHLSWQLVAVGDILLAGSATPVLHEVGYTTPFAPYIDIIQNADVAYGNLEAPVGIKGAPILGKTFTFQMPPAALEALSFVGFDVLHLANNHILDFGPEALAETTERIAKAGLKTCGAGQNIQAARQPAFLTTANGVNFAFVCYSLTFPEEFWADHNKPGTAFGHEAWVRADIAAAKAKADVVIAGFHWGAERMFEPKRYQRELAAAAIAAGASAVIGHHPHVLQPIEINNATAVAYSLGNFIFGSYSSAVSDSALLRLRGIGAHITEVAVLPIDVHNPRVDFHPRDLTVDKAKTVAEFLLGTTARQDGRWWIRPTSYIKQ